MEEQPPKSPERCVSPDSGDDDDNEEEEDEAGEEDVHGGGDPDHATGEGDPPTKPTVIVIARSHPGDSATSFVSQGMIEFLTSGHAIAAELGAKVNFVIFPMMNPDGVFLGNARSGMRTHRVEEGLVLSEFLSY